MKIKQKEEIDLAKVISDVNNRHLYSDRVFFSRTRVQRNGFSPLKTEETKHTNKL